MLENMACFPYKIEKAENAEGGFIMDDCVSKFQAIEKAIKDAEKCVLLMENQKQELDFQLKEAGFDSLEDLQSCCEGLTAIAEEEEEKLAEKIEELQNRLEDLADA